MDSIILSVKNIVIIIVASEFLKSFLIGDSFKKYITVCVNIIVIGFIISQIRNVPLDFAGDFETYRYDDLSYENHIKTNYENKAEEEIKKQLTKNKILVYSVDFQANDDYSVKKIILHINGNEKKAEEILKGLELKNYEIITDNKQDI